MKGISCFPRRFILLIRILQWIKYFSTRQCAEIAYKKYNLFINSLSSSQHINYKKFCKRYPPDKVSGIIFNVLYICIMVTISALTTFINADRT